MGYKTYASVPSKGQYLINVCNNNKWGFINKSGKQIVPFKYDTLSEFTEGLASVCHNDKLGFIDETGKEVIPLSYIMAVRFTEGLSSVC